MEVGREAADRGRGTMFNITTLLRGMYVLDDHYWQCLSRCHLECHFSSPSIQQRVFNQVASSITHPIGHVLCRSEHFRLDDADSRMKTVRVSPARALVLRRAKTRNADDA